MDRAQWDTKSNANKGYSQQQRIQLTGGPEGAAEKTLRKAP